MTKRNFRNRRKPHYKSKSKSRINKRNNKSRKIRGG